MTHGTTTDGPNQLRAAEGVTAVYDEAGNLVELLVDRRVGRTPGACETGTGSKCLQWFAYDWDEAGRLLRARRWDFDTSFPVVAPPVSASERAVPAETPVRDLRFGYSMGERVVTWKRDEVETLRTTANVLPTLRIDAAEFVDGDYLAGALHQRARLGGMAEVRIDPTLPSPSGTDRHMFLSLADELGSSTVILDYETGELVERVTYQTYGATDQDLRPARWGAHREPMRFTGKEDDVEIGLTYFGARYYAPNLHQWASADPLAIHALGADLNPYAYVSGRTTTMVDPFGLEGCKGQQPGEDCVVVHGPPRRDVQYNDRGAIGSERLERWASGAGQRLAEWNREWMQSVNWVSLGILESLPVSPIPGAPTLTPAVNGLGVGQSEGARAARIVGQIIGFGFMMAAGNEAAALERTAVLAVGKGARGSAGARQFDASAAGGPVRRLSTEGVRVTQRGVDVVERHLARFGPDAPNQGMVARLRSIAGGQLKPAAADMNFYTHELREFVRYRRLGFTIGAGEDYTLWNNAHSAALADYGLVEGPGVLYHPSVLP